ncbi:hypothetical protein RE070_004033 [Klebsiella aerogenes]|nr:hypothetical protein [Klebsiella aerogenes]
MFMLRRIQPLEALFRVVPPALYLALAMTEKHEKAERMRIMKEMGCSEVEAAMKLTKDVFISRDPILLTPVILHT